MSARSPRMHTCYPCDTYVEQYPVCEMRKPQMDPRSAGLSRATASVHMLNPSYYCSICLPSSSTLLTWLECLMMPQRSSSSVPWLSSQTKKQKKKKSGPVWEPRWHIRSSVCPSALKPSALNPKQNEQAVSWLLRQPPGFMR